MSMMTIDEIVERIPVWYNSSTTYKGPSYHIESDPGRGKTWTCERFPQIMDRLGITVIDKDTGKERPARWGFVLIPGESTTLSGLCGFQQLLNPTNKSELLRSVFSLPHWWYDRNGTPITWFDGVLILVDEYDKMELECKKQVAAMRLDKRVANHYLPDGAVVWTAGNFKKNRSGFTKDFDFSINRTITLGVKDSLEGFINWAEGEPTMLSEIISFANENPLLLFMEAPAVQGPWMTPRSTHQVSIHLKSVMDTFGLKEIPIDMKTQAEVAGSIGKIASEKLFIHIRLKQELPDYMEVVSHPENVNIPNTADQMRLFIYKIAEKSKPQHARELLTWLTRFPNEFQIMFARMVGARHPLVIAQPAFREWSKTNAALMAVVAAYAKNNQQAA